MSSVKNRHGRHDHMIKITHTALLCTPSGYYLNQTGNARIT